MANRSERGVDPVFESERGTGSTPPERAEEGTSVVGRPAVEHPRTAFHEPAETDAEEREPFNPEEALKEGGSFDAVAPPGDQTPG